MATNLQEIIPAIFTGPNGERLTPEQIAQRQKVAMSLLGRATDTSPDAGGWASVLTKGILGYKSGADQRAADAAIKANAEQSQNDIAALLNGGAGFPSAVASGASPTSAVATGTPVSVPTGDMAGTIRQGLIDRGLQPHIADAFILNFQDESGLNPGINEKNPIVPGSRGGFGLYQLTGPRRREYEAFASARGVNPADINTQLDFLAGELGLPVQGVENLPFFGSEGKAARSILSAPDTATAAQAIVNNFLRPAPEHRQSRSAKYGRVATTPQEAIAQVAPQGGDLVMAGDNGNFNDRWNAGAVSPEVPAVAPTPTPSPAVASALMPPPQTGTSDPRLLELNDRMLGGALSPSGSSPVAQALSGYFPDAPVASQPSIGNQMATIARIIGSPYASNEAKQVALGMYQRQIDATDPMKQAEQQYKLAQIQALQAKAANPNGDESFFGNPIAIQNPDGSISYGQIGNRGSFKPIQLGEGQTFAPPTKTIDTGTEIVQMTQNGEVISRTPKQNREAAAQTAAGGVEGKTEAERRLAAPSDIQAGQNALDILDQIERHPGIDIGTGWTSMGNAIPGSPGYDFQNVVKQAQSGAFLSAIQQMRGMGSLSNAEGEAATAAVTRMDTATSKEAFLAALNDYRKIVKQGMERAQKNAGGSTATGGNGGKRTSTGVTWSVE